MRRPTHGTLLQLSDGAASNPTYTTIAHVRTIKPPAITVAPVVLEDHDMTDGKEYLPAGLGDVGPADFEIYLDPQNAGHQTLYSLAKARTTEDWRIVLPNSAGTWDFSGFITKYDPQPIDANDGVLEANCSIQATAAPDLA